MDNFLSTHLNKIDKKGRVSVPAPFRAALAAALPADTAATGIVLYRALHHDALEACSTQHLELLSASLDNLNLPPETYELIETTIFGGSMHLPFDPEGRVTVPEHFLQAVAIDDTVAFFGRRNTFQLWQPAKLNAFVDSQRTAAKAQDISLSKIIADARRLSLNGGM